MIYRHWYTAAVGNKTPEAQENISLLKLCLPHVIILEHEEDNPVDPNALKVMAIIDGEKRFIGWVPNRARCNSCDPEEQTFGHADYENAACPACGATDPKVWIRGIATQIIRYTSQPGYTAHAEVHGFYIGKSKQQGVRLFLRIETSKVPSFLPPVPSNIGDSA